MKTNGYDAAFATPAVTRDGDSWVEEQGNVGLTKREYFAAMAMQGLAVPAIPGGHNSNQLGEAAMKAEMAVRLADALIKALNGEKP